MISWTAIPPKLKRRIVLALLVAAYAIVSIHHHFAYKRAIAEISAYDYGESLSIYDRQAFCSKIATVKPEFDGGAPTVSAAKLLDCLREPPADERRTIAYDDPHLIAASNLFGVSYYVLGERAQRGSTNALISTSRLGTLLLFSAVSTAQYEALARGDRNLAAKLRSFASFSLLNSYSAIVKRHEQLANIEDSQPYITRLAKIWHAQSLLDQQAQSDESLRLKILIQYWNIQHPLMSDAGYSTEVINSQARAWAMSIAPGSKLTPQKIQFAAAPKPK